MAQDFFISYSRHDYDLAMLFYNRLTQLGYSVWIDKNGIESGDSFKKVIVQAIKQSRALLFLSSINSNESLWVTKEVGIAVKVGIPVLPILLDKTPFNEDIEFDMVNLDFLDFSTSSTRVGQMEHFIRSINKRFPLGHNNEIQQGCPTISSKSEIESSEVYKQFRNVLVDKLGVDYSEITPSTSFINDLGCDSIDAIEILADVEYIFEIKIPDEELSGMTIVEDAVNLIISYQKMYGLQ